MPVCPMIFGTLSPGLAIMGYGRAIQTRDDRHVWSAETGMENAQEQPHCRNCGYDLRGSHDGKWCPECAWPIGMPRVYGRQPLLFDTSLLVALLACSVTAIPFQLFVFSMGYHWRALTGPEDPMHSMFWAYPWNVITCVQGVGAMAAIALVIILCRRPARMPRLGLVLSTLGACCALFGAIARSYMQARHHPADPALAFFCTAVFVLVRCKFAAESRRSKGPGDDLVNDSPDDV